MGILRIWIRIPNTKTKLEEKHTYLMYCTHLKRSLPVLLKLTERDLTATSTSVFC
jgi:hypothetical protein